MSALQQNVLFIGYKVAIGRRSTDKIKLDGVLGVFVDVTRPETIKAAFAEVESKLGAPNVVVYNAAALTLAPNPADPFAIDLATFSRDHTANTNAAYAALHHATRLARSQTISSAPSLVFIATGNVTPFKIAPAAVTLSAGKSALAHLVQLGDVAYDRDRFRFYFASQVTEHGGPVPYPQVDGKAHGEAYWKLVDGVLDGWNVRFTASYGLPGFV